MQSRFLRSLPFVAALLFCVASAARSADSVEPKRIKLQVDDRERTALVYAPAELGDGAHPLMFVFHGHGGTAESSARRTAYHTHWPEAVCVYPQGIPTPGRLTDPEGKRNGWQSAAGDQEDRDLKFFDALLARLKTDYQIDEKRIYSSGHSNGGGFTYLLWSARGDIFAAVAPSSSAASRLQDNGLKPKPAFHLAGENDPLVKFAWQKIMIERVRELNGCEKEGRPAGKYCTEYPSSGGTPLVTYIHPGGHEFPAGAAERMVQFFKQHAKP